MTDDSGSESIDAVLAAGHGHVTEAGRGCAVLCAVAVAALALSGCYRTHGRGHDGGPDAARSIDAAVADAAVRPDARVTDGGPPELTTCHASRDDVEPHVVWATTLVRSYEDRGTAELPEIHALPSGGVIVATAAEGRAVIVRETNERMEGEAFCVVARFDALGTLVWRVEFDGCDVIDLGVAPDESVCVLGRFEDGADFGRGRLSGEGMYVLSLGPDGLTRFASPVRGSGGDALDVACDTRTVAMGAGRDSVELSIDDAVVLPASTDGGGFVTSWELDGGRRWTRAVDGVAAAIAIDPAGAVWVAEHALSSGGVAVGRIETLSGDDGASRSAIELAASPEGVAPALMFDEIEITPAGMWLTGRFHGRLELPGGRSAIVWGALDAGFVARLGPDGSGEGLAITTSASSPLYVNLSALGDEQAVVAGAFRGEGNFAGLGATATVGTDVFALAVRADGSPSWLRTFADEPSPRAGAYVTDDNRWRAPADVSARSTDEIYVAGRFLSRIALGDCVLTGEEMNSFLVRLAEH